MRRQLLTLCALEALALGAQAQPINRTLEAAADGHVVVELVDGSLTVRGWDRTQIEISGRLGGDAQRLDVAQQGAETRLRVIAGESDGGRDRERTELVVSAPRGSRLTVSGTNADLLVVGIEGPQALHTVSGDIGTELYGAGVAAETVGGDIELSSRRGPATAAVSTVAGDVDAAGPLASLTVTTISGDIELDVLDAERLILNTTSGEIEVHATLADDAELSAETTNGDVELRVGEEGRLNVDVGTFSGRIEVCFDGRDTAGSAAQDRGDRRGREHAVRGGALTLSAGPESPRIRVRTLNGDIELCSA